MDMASGPLTEAVFPLGGDAEAGRSAEVEVRDLHYTILPKKKKDKSREVLKGISCSFPPGRLSAMMGASGSGKTSLLTLLRGLSSPGSELRGSIFCNGRPVSLNLMRNISSVVPQEDVFLSALTVRETLAYAAQLRLPARCAEAERDVRVKQIIKLLKLESCADAQVGDDRLAIRGISGGERRRLSIGTAVIGGLPQLLLCDEPTSGLDSAAAHGIVTFLKSLADRGVTVLCAIHQPSYPIFCQFSHLLLLEAGEAVFCGRLGDVEQHFSNHGAPTPEKTNPAHHYISEVQERGDQWAERWRSSAPQLPALPASSGFPRGQTPSGGKSNLTPAQQAKVLARRTLLENFKNKKKFFRGIMARLPASMMCGCFFWRVAAEPTQGMVFPLKGVMFLIIQNSFVDSFYAGAATFQQTKGLLKREYYDGLYKVAPYYASYYIGFMAMQIPWAISWVLPLYVLSGLPPDMSEFSIFMMIGWLVIVMGTALGSAVGATTKDTDGARAILAPLMIMMILFSGYVIPYGQIPSIWKPLYYLSPVQWGMSILETNHYEGLRFVDCDDSVPLAERHCFATGDEYLKTFGNPLAFTVGKSGMIAVLATYLGLFLSMNTHVIKTSVLDGRV